MQNTSIEVDRLHKSCDGQPVLLGVSFAAGVKRIFGIAGRDSAGRATTVKILQGLRSRDDGHAPRAGHPRLGGLRPTDPRDKWVALSELGFRAAGDC
jgi:ABC-type multidrug transport system ATPase subunit